MSKVNNALSEKTLKAIETYWKIKKFERNLDDEEFLLDKWLEKLSPEEYDQYVKRTVGEEQICSICERTFTGFGNNAQPVNDGRCCDDCNYTSVVPARLKAMEERE